ncbi:MAG: type II toxin-antitoxin system HicA family toxin [Patescibacteria group bacterium]
MSKLGTVHWREFEKFLFEHGCQFKREKGDHRIYWKKGLIRPIIVPREIFHPLWRQMIFVHLELGGLSLLTF